VRQDFAALPAAPVEESVPHRQAGLVGVTMRLHGFAKWLRRQKLPYSPGPRAATVFGRE